MVRVLALLLLVLPFPALALRVGVLAPAGLEEAEEAWTPIVEYLSAESGMEMELIPLLPWQGIDALLGSEIDILIGNPVQSAVVSDLAGAHLLASVVRPGGDRFGGDPAP